MKPSQAIYTLRKLRAALVEQGDEQGAQALEIAVQAVESAQDAERLHVNGRKKSMPVERARGPVVLGAPRLGGITDYLAARRAECGRTNV